MKIKDLTDNLKLKLLHEGGHRVWTSEKVKERYQDFKREVIAKLPQGLNFVTEFELKEA